MLAFLSLLLPCSERFCIAEDVGLDAAGVIDGLEGEVAHLACCLDGDVSVVEQAGEQAGDDLGDVLDIEQTTFTVGAAQAQGNALDVYDAIGCEDIDVIAPVLPLPP